MADPRAGVWWVALFVLVTAGLTACQDEPITSSATEQIAWGEALHGAHCARCHAPERSGPVLSLRTLATTHATAHDLFAFTESSMPLDDPGVLPDEDYWAILAFLLDREDSLGLPRDATLGPDNAAEVPIGRDRPLEIGPDVHDEDTNAEGG